MKIEIQKDSKNWGRDVLKDGKKIGTVRKFCCGIDYRPLKGKSLFSIMGTPHNYQCSQLKTCIKAIEGLKKPKKQFHWNFSYELAKDENKLKKYENQLNKI